MPTLCKLLCVALRMFSCADVGQPAPPGLGGAPLRVAVYNPLAMTRPGRLLQVLNELDVDICCIPGTALFHPRTGSDAYITYRLEKYQIISWGWSSASMSNKSAGIIIALGSRLANNTKIEVLSPPEEVQGRAGAIRIKTQYLDLPLLLVTRRRSLAHPDKGSAS